MHKLLLGKRYQDMRTGDRGELVSRGDHWCKLRDKSGKKWTVPTDQLVPAKRAARKPVDGWIQTFTNLQVFPLEPDPAGIVIEDVAASLSKTARFNGHTQGNLAYSVAQHSVVVSRLCPTKPLAGLLHDAAEAYLGDIAKPVKMEIDRLTGGLLTQIEDRILRAVSEAFLVPYGDLICPEVKGADKVALATEKRDLMGEEPWPWHPLPEPAEFELCPWGPKLAREMFLDRFRELT